MKIKFLGTHNAESKTSRLVSFVIDDVLAVEAGSLSSGLSFTEQHKIRCILLSHGHYDHIRDIPSLAFNAVGNGSEPAPKVVGLANTLHILETHLIDGVIYPEFAASRSYLGRAVLELLAVEAYKPETIAGYRVTALPVNHTIVSVGFEIVSASGKSLFYTGDTGPGLASLWQRVSPQTLVIDTTFPSRLRETAQKSGHLCPETLKAELQEFRLAKHYLPKVILVHLSPDFETEIRREVDALAADLNAPVAVASEGEIVEL